MTVDADYPMSAKVYSNYSGPEKGMLASFTTIVPGAGKGKDPYWTIVDAWHHLVEVAFCLFHFSPFILSCLFLSYFLFLSSFFLALYVGVGLRFGYTFRLKG